MMRLLLFLLLIPTLGLAQTQANSGLYRQLGRADKAYAKGKYTDAETRYRPKINADTLTATARYNLGNSIYKQEQVLESRSAYAEALKRATDKTQKHRIYHNLGNVFMKEKQYDKAVEAYKSALRNNPHDEETRYNYVLARELLKDNPPPPNQGDDKNQDKDQNKNQDQQQQQQQQPQDQEDQGDQEQDKDKPKENEQPSNQPKVDPKGMSAENLERLLEAVDNEEQKVQKRIKGQKDQAKPQRPEKEW